MSDRPSCYKCGEPAIALYEGHDPPDGTIRRATCAEHTFPSMEPIQTFGDGSTGRYHVSFEYEIEEGRSDLSAVSVHALGFDNAVSVAKGRVSWPDDVEPSIIVKKPGGDDV